MSDRFLTWFDRKFGWMCVIVGVAFFAVALLAGCADSEPAPATPTKSAVEVDGGIRLTVVTMDVGGRSVNCVVLTDTLAGKRSGVSCDFTRSAT